MLKLLILAAGIFLLIWGVYLYKKQNDFIKTAEKAEGIVVDLQSQDNNQRTSNSKVRTLYAPIINFISKDNKEIRFTSSYAASPALYEINEKVTVYYDPKTPENARLNSLFHLWGGAITAGLIGLVFILMGIALISNKV